MSNNLSRLVTRYILTRPSIQSCLNGGLINHSALARAIALEHALDESAALSMACRRAAARIQNKKGGDAKIRALVTQAYIRVTNRVAVLIVQRGRDLASFLELERRVRKERGTCNILSGDEVVTVVLPESFVPVARELFGDRVLRVNQKLSQISMIFDKRIEATAGVVAFVYGLLAHHGINVLEEMSCWTDLLLLIKEDDVGPALEALRC